MKRLANPLIHIVLALLLLAFLVKDSPYVRQFFDDSARATTVENPEAFPEGYSGEVDLNGTWLSDAHDICRITQNGNQVFWKGVSIRHNGEAFNHTFHGELNGLELEGHYHDRTPGRQLNKGKLKFVVVGPNWCRLKGTSKLFDGLELKRRGD